MAHNLVCEECGKAYTVKKVHRTRRFCSRHCSAIVTYRNNRARYKQRAEGQHDAAIENVEFLIGTDCASRIAERTGFPNEKYMLNCLTEWGRRDLADKLREPPTGKVLRGSLVRGVL